MAEAVGEAACEDGLLRHPNGGPRT
jgi:hypothetical protein